jgi:hypothetical protein
MTTTNKPSPKPSSIATSIKALFASLAVAAILGFWALFSRDLKPATKAADVPDGSSTQPETGSESDFIASLPPIPTLAPLPNQQVAFMPNYPGGSTSPVVFPGQTGAAVVNSSSTNVTYKEKTSTKSTGTTTTKDPVTKTSSSK